MGQELGAEPCRQAPQAHHHPLLVSGQLLDRRDQSQILCGRSNLSHADELMSEQYIDEKHLLDAHNIIINDPPLKPAHMLSLNLESSFMQTVTSVAVSFSITMLRTLNHTLFHTPVFPTANFSPVQLRTAQATGVSITGHERELPELIQLFAED